MMMIMGFLRVSEISKPLFVSPCNKEHFFGGLFWETLFMETAYKPEVLVMVW